MSAGFEMPIPQRVVDLVRHVYAMDAGMAANNATTGLTMQQVIWAWSVVGALCRLGIAADLCFCGCSAMPWVYTGSGGAALTCLTAALKAVPRAADKVGSEREPLHAAHEQHQVQERGVRRGEGRVLQKDHSVRVGRGVGPPTTRSASIYRLADI